MLLDEVLKLVAYSVANVTVEDPPHLLVIYPVITFSLHVDKAGIYRQAGMGFHAAAVLCDAVAWRSKCGHEGAALSVAGVFYARGGHRCLSLENFTDPALDLLFEKLNF